MIGRRLFLFLWLTWPFLATAASRQELDAQFQQIEDALRDVPQQASALLEKVASNPLVQNSPELRLKVIVHWLEYESVTKTFRNSERLLDEGFTLLKSHPDPKIEITLLQSKAAFAYDHDKIDGVRADLDRAFELSLKLGDYDSQALVLSNQGNLEKDEANYQAALIHYLQAYELVKNKPESEVYGSVANRLALFYVGGLRVRIGEGIKILEELVKRIRESSTPRRQDLQIYLSNLGFAYASDNQLALAKKTFESAKKLAVEIEDWTGVAYCEKYLGAVLIQEKKWAEALRALQPSFLYFEKTNNLLQIAAVAEKKMEAHLELKDRRSAASDWKIIQSQMGPKLSIQSRLNHALLRGRLATLEGRWKDAYESFDQVNRLEKKLADQKNVESSLYYAALFNIERKERENKRLEQKGRLQVLELDNHRKKSEMLSWILISTGLIAIIFAVDFFRVRKRRHKISELTESLQKNLLQRYLPNQMVQEVMAGRKNIEDSPRQRRVTVLQCELCNFTRAVEILGPHRVGRMLNTYLGEMMDVIGHEGGLIDKFVNGTILAVFGVPGTAEEAEQAQAVARCSRMMQARLEELNRVWQQSEGWVFAMRIGIHQGSGLVGMLGAPHRQDYMVVGPVVDIVGQVCSRGAPGDTLLSGALVPFLDPQSLISVSRIHPGVDGEVFSLLRLSA